MTPPHAAVTPAIAFVAYLAAGGAFAALLAAEATPRVPMIEEDSHPHEVRPGTEARFHAPAVDRPSRLDVKCMLSGPAGPVRLLFDGIDPKGWARANRRFAVGAAEIGIDIEGVVEPGRPAPYFAFANDDPERLLWHQCYNN